MNEICVSTDVPIPSAQSRETLLIEMKVCRARYTLSAFKIQPDVARYTQYRYQKKVKITCYIGMGLCYGKGCIRGDFAAAAAFSPHPQGKLGVLGASSTCLWT